MQKVTIHVMNTLRLTADLNNIYYSSFYLTQQKMHPHSKKFMHAHTVENTHSQSAESRVSECQKDGMYNDHCVLKVNYGLQLNYRMEHVILKVAHTYPFRCLACIYAHIETL
jgi:hypothetical protein